MRDDRVFPPASEPAAVVRSGYRQLNGGAGEAARLTIRIPSPQGSFHGVADVGRLDLGAASKILLGDGDARCCPARRHRRRPVASAQYASPDTHGRTGHPAGMPASGPAVSRTPACLYGRFDIDRLGARGRTRPLYVWEAKLEKLQRNIRSLSTFDHRSLRRSDRPARLRSAERPAWRKNRQCTNFRLGRRPEAGQCSQARCQPGTMA